MKIIPLYLLGCAVLASCTDGSISTVKNQNGPGQKINYGQALDNFKSCQNITWKHSKDNYDRNTVVYTCEFNILPALVEKARKDSEQKLISEISRQDRIYLSAKGDAERALGFNAFGSAHEKETKEIEETIEKLNSAQSKIATLKNTSPAVFAQENKLPFSTRSEVEEATSRLNGDIRSRERWLENAKLDSRIKVEDFQRRQSSALAVTASRKPEQEAILKKIDEFNEKYYSVLKTMEGSGNEKIKAYFSKDHELKWSISFSVIENSVEVTGFQWVLDGKPQTSSLLSEAQFLGSVFTALDNKNSSQYIDKTISEKITMQAADIYERFPYRCNVAYGCMEN